MPLDTLVLLIVILLMIVVGTEILPAQLTAVLQQPRALLSATLAQFIFLPALAVLLILVLQPPTAVAGGLLLVAASPGGALSNFYCLLGRLHLALSVTLTTLTGFTAVVIMPVVLAMIAPLTLGLQAFAVPVGELALRLVFFLLLPIGLGMLLRHYWSAQLDKHARALRAGSIGLLIVFLILVLLDQQDAAITMLIDITQITVIFTTLALVGGWLIARLLGWQGGDRAVLAIEFAVRNVGIAAVIALSTFAQPAFAAFGALFLILQLPLLVFLLLLLRRKTNA